MFKYQKYLLKNISNEKEMQKDKRYCDGSMQKYLDKKWAKEDKYIHDMIIYDR